jgi:hypothetical protein
MMFRNLATYCVAATAGAAMLALSLSPASAFTLSGPSLERPVASAQIDHVWWHRGYGWGWHHGWGGPGWGGGGWRHCWINRWGNRVCRW